MPIAPHGPQGIWLHSRPYDLLTFVALPLGLYGLLITASALMGPQSGITLYTISAVLTGFSHNWITWLLIMPRASRGYYEPGTIFGPFVLTALVLVPVVLFYNTPTFAWALTVSILIAYHHITRQHMGILFSADGRYLAAGGDDGIRGLSRDLRRLIAAVAAAGLAWKLVGPPCLLGIVGHPMQFQLYPLPLAVPIACTLAGLVYAGRALVSILARTRAGRPFPTVHALVAGSAIANLIAANLLPNAQTFLSLAIIASYHNLQYFAFCYTHHRLRATADPLPQDFFTRWARDGKAGRWFGLPVALGVALGLVFAVIPPFWSSVAGFWFMTSHYFVDGQIWRRKFYPLMPRFAKGRPIELRSTVRQAAAPVEGPLVS